MIWAWVRCLALASRILTARSRYFSSMVAEAHGQRGIVVRLFVVDRHAGIATAVDVGQHEAGVAITGIGGTHEPSQAFLKILGDLVAVKVGHTDLALGLGIAGLGQGQPGIEGHGLGPEASPTGPGAQIVATISANRQKREQQQQDRAKTGGARIRTNAAMAVLPGGRAKMDAAAVTGLLFEPAHHVAQLGADLLDGDARR